MVIHIQYPVRHSEVFRCKNISSHSNFSLIIFNFCCLNERNKIHQKMIATSQACRGKALKIKRTKSVKKTLWQPHYWQTAFLNERNITRQISLCTSSRCQPISNLICDLYLNLISKFHDANANLAQILLRDALLLFSCLQLCVRQKFVILYIFL